MKFEIDPCEEMKNVPIVALDEPTVRKAATLYNTVHKTVLVVTWE